MADMMQYGGIAVGIIVLIVVLYSWTTTASQFSALSSQVNALKGQVSSIQIPASQTVDLAPAVAQIKRNMTWATDFTLVGFVLPANQSRVLFDIAGLGGSASIEMNVKLDQIGALPQDVQLQVLNATTFQWQNVGEAGNAPALGTFPVDARGDIHNDEQGVNAVRLVNLDPNNAAVFNSDSDISLTLNGRSS